MGNERHIIDSCSWINTSCHYHKSKAINVNLKHHVASPSVVLGKLSFVSLYLQYKEKRLEQEKELLQGQVSWLTEELKTKSEELLSLSREKSSEILELKCSLNSKEDEVWSS